MRFASGRGGMADALVEGLVGVNPVEVQVLSAAPISYNSILHAGVV